MWKEWYNLKTSIFQPLMKYLIQATELVEDNTVWKVEGRRLQWRGLTGITWPHWPCLVGWKTRRVFSEMMQEEVPSMSSGLSPKYLNPYQISF